MELIVGGYQAIVFDPDMRRNSCEWIVGSVSECGLLNSFLPPCPAEGTKAGFAVTVYSLMFSIRRWFLVKAVGGSLDEGEGEGECGQVACNGR